MINFIHLIDPVIEVENVIYPVLNSDSAKWRKQSTKLLYSPEHETSSSALVPHDTNFRYEFASILSFLEKNQCVYIAL